MLTPPKPPTGLKTLGKQVWNRSFKNEHITEDDYSAVLLLCKLHDERKQYEDALKKGADLIWINNETNIIIHPYIKRIEAIDKQILLLLKELGLTPNSRVGENANASNPLTSFLVEYKNER